MNEIKRKEQKINNEFFNEYLTNYWCPSSMHNKWSETKVIENEVRVDLFKEVLIEMKRNIKNVKDNVLKIEENEEIIYIVKRILELQWK